MKGHPIIYSPAELAWIEANKTLPRREAHAGFQAKFARIDVSLKNINGLCHRRGWKTGTFGGFKPGNVPWSKGKKMPYNANTARTQFKKGNLPANTKHLGHERLSDDGYILISVAEKNPRTGYERRYVLKHRHLWQQANGELPPGTVLVCIDGDKTNTNPTNWKAVPRAMMLRLNGRWAPSYHKADPEVKPTLMAIAELEHAARTKSARGRDHA